MVDIYTSPLDQSLKVEIVKHLDRHAIVSLEELELLKHLKDSKIIIDKKHLKSQRLICNSLLNDTFNNTKMGQSQKDIKPDENIHLPTNFVSGLSSCLWKPETLIRQNMDPRTLVSFEELILNQTFQIETFGQVAADSVKFWKKEAEKQLKLVGFINLPLPSKNIPIKHKV
jgi:hypothetical protein